MESFFGMRQATTYGEEANEVIRQHRDGIETGGCHEGLDISGSRELFLLPAFLQEVVNGVPGDLELLLVHGRNNHHCHGRAEDAPAFLVFLQIPSSIVHKCCNVIQLQKKCEFFF